MNIADQINKGADIATDGRHLVINTLGLKDQNKHKLGKVLYMTNRFTKYLPQPETLQETKKSITIITIKTRKKHISFLHKSMKYVFAQSKSLN
ncbi:hypothetical protein SS50377_21617 [Spironucleus salmonicida]|uniref:Uncharacterized protein n=1 Tax=Spironucleus salmonicida TaxID=348837 RepID=A0A9P8LWW4_9EUKA|nr:hypothetical protein SS50377_21617 [Spironucleus salmonicida]